MATTIDAFVIDKEYADGEILTESQLDAALVDSGVTNVEGYLNTKVTPNLVQLAKDCEGDDYTFNDNGTANFVWTLYEKQWDEKLYNGGDISIGAVTDVAFASVDAINASITFTPERTGKYRVTFVFTHLFEISPTSDGQCEVIFRIYDGTTDSVIARSGGYFGAPAANSIRFMNPITLTYIFDATDTNPVTFILQKRVMDAVNITTNQVSATATTGEFYATVEKI